MTVLIKGLEMPEACDLCPFCDDSAMCVVLGIDLLGDGEELESLWYIPGGYKPDKCPLAHVPPHGDLIDRDALLRQYHGIIWTAQTDYAEGLRDIVNDIKDAPTVIEAEGKA